jgi:hypothetical protein
LSFPLHFANFLLIAFSLSFTFYFRPRLPAGRFLLFTFTLGAGRACQYIPTPAELPPTMIDLFFANCLPGWPN